MSQATKVKKQKRFPADQRRKMMMEDAAEYFAKHGFDRSTRHIADEIGVTQGLIYFHFDSLEDFIQLTIEHQLGSLYQATNWNDATPSLEDSIVDYYCDFFEEMTETKFRLFLMASLAGRKWSTWDRDRASGSGLLEGFVSRLRNDLGLPELESLPITDKERELVLSLHGAVVYLQMRRYVFKTAEISDITKRIRCTVSAFIEGAPAKMRAIHRDNVRNPPAIPPNE